MKGYVNSRGTAHGAFDPPRYLGTTDGKRIYEVEPGCGAPSYEICLDDHVDIDNPHVKPCKRRGCFG